MNIIFVSNNMAKARTLTLRQVILLLIVLTLLPVLLTLVLILPQAAQPRQAVQAMLPNPLHFVLHNPQQHLDALAKQLGEIQARVLQLGVQSDRLEQMAATHDVNQDKPQTPAPVQKRLPVGDSGKLLPPGRGGPQVHAYGMTEAQLQQQIALLAAEIERRSDRLSELEALVLQQTIRSNVFPSGKPVDATYNSSSYGWRIDPFTGSMAFHEGLDFTAAPGTPVYAAAGGIVTAAEQQPDYGKIVKINHGSGLETRYAHASLLLVKAGDRVEKGQLIAEVGTTGRSTGAHLHFEVRLNGAPLDPRKYLRQQNG